jgi:hypothetical protein
LPWGHHRVGVLDHRDLGGRGNHFLISSSVLRVLHVLGRRGL